MAFEGHKVKYPLPLCLLHWLMAALILGMLAAGLIMTGMAHGNPYRGLLYSLHKSFGITLFALALARIAVRLRSPVPALPSAIPPAERALARLGHLALYGFMLAMPVSGYLLSTWYGLPVRWFDVTLPRLVGVDRAKGALAGDFHSYAAYALIGLLALHILAVLLHYLKQRINLLQRML